MKVKELIDAKAPYSEIAKIDPKIADEGQAMLFLKRYDSRYAFHFKLHQGHKDKKSWGSFRYSTESRPRSLYKLKVAALHIQKGPEANRLQPFLFSHR